MTIVRSYRTPNGNWVKMAVRPDLVDEPVIASTSQHDEYGVAAFDLGPDDLMVDVGAYIGSVGLAVAADYPDCRVVMVEAVPENVAVIRESIEVNGWHARVFVHHAAAAAKHGRSTIRFGTTDEPGSFRYTNQFIGDLRALDAPMNVKVTNITLRDILDRYGAIAVLKIDCEGCEYPFFEGGGMERVGYIIGEYHGGIKRIEELLDATHDVEFYPENESVGIFKARLVQMRTVKP